MSGQRIEGVGYSLQIRAVLYGHAEYTFELTLLSIVNKSSGGAYLNDYFVIAYYISIYSYLFTLTFPSSVWHPLSIHISLDI